MLTFKHFRIFCLLSFSSIQGSKSQRISQICCNDANFLFFYAWLSPGLGAPSCSPIWPILKASRNSYLNPAKRLPTVSPSQPVMLGIAYGAFGRHNSEYALFSGVYADTSHKKKNVCVREKYKK